MVSTTPGQYGGTHAPAHRCRPPRPGVRRAGIRPILAPRRPHDRGDAPASSPTRRASTRADETRTSTWWSAETICGRWPSTTTGRAVTGDASPPPIPNDSPAVRIGCRSAGSCASPAWIGLIADRAESKSTAAARARSASDEESDDVRTVVVKRDDTLSAIAERFYGAEERWPVLWRANRHQLDDPDELLIGMRLVVPTLKADRSDDDGPGTAREKPRARARTAEHGLPEPAPTCTQSRHRSRRRAASATDLAPIVSARPSARPRHRRRATVRTPTGNGAEPARRGRRRDAANATDATDAIAAGLAAVGALLAASLITGLAARRRLQLQARPVGRRILQPDETARAAEQVLGPRARVLGLRTLDLATRAISAHCHAHESAVAVSDRRHRRR